MSESYNCRHCSSFWFNWVSSSCSLSMSLSRASIIAPMHKFLVELKLFVENHSLNNFYESQVKKMLEDFSDLGQSNILDSPILLHRCSLSSISGASSSRVGSADSTASSVLANSASSTEMIIFWFSLFLLWFLVWPSLFVACDTSLVTKFAGKRPEKGDKWSGMREVSGALPLCPLRDPSHQFGSDSSMSVIISPALKVSSLSSAASKSYNARTVTLPFPDVPFPVCCSWA